MTGFFNVIKRQSDPSFEASLSNAAIENHGNKNVVRSVGDLYSVPYCQEYQSSLTKAAELLHEAGNLTNSARYYVYSIFASCSSKLFICLNKSCKSSFLFL